MEWGSLLTWGNILMWRRSCLSFYWSSKMLMWRKEKLAVGVSLSFWFFFKFYFITEVFLKTKKTKRSRWASLWLNQHHYIMTWKAVGWAKGNRWKIMMETFIQLTKVTVSTFESLMQINDHFMKTLYSRICVDFFVNKQKQRQKFSENGIQSEQLLIMKGPIRTQSRAQTDYV